MVLIYVGDKYTRYLTPAQYGALMNSAVGELIGMLAYLAITSSLEY